MRVSDGVADRAGATLLGLAIGDALGMPSQTLDRATIRATYGQISDFVAPMAGHPVSHGLDAAMVTDDTEQTLLLARRLILDRGGFDAAAWAADLMGWEESVTARGLRDLLGPSTKAALEALRGGASPAEAGHGGRTNGAAMRIAPVAICTPPDPLRMVARVAEVSRLTHGAGEALAGAVAVAMVISLGVEGVGFEAALPAALAAAVLPIAGADPMAQVAMVDRIRAALKLAVQGEAVLARDVGTSVQSLESVACAFGVVRLAAGDPWAAALIGANIGDDTDTIAGIACMMAAAGAGMGALPADKVARVIRANGLDLDDLDDLVAGLLDLRRAGSGGVNSARLSGGAL